MNGFIDLFSGAGGWSLGLEMSGMKCTGMFDLDKSSCTTARFNFNCPVHEWDLRIQKPKSLPKGTSIIVGSPPCQGFSNEGKKNKLDPRNDLVWEFFNVVEELKPDVWLFENVPGFKRSYDGHFFEILIERLNEMDYNYKTFFLDSQHFGVPQKRKRFFAIGAKKFVPSEPIPTHGHSLLSRKGLVTFWEALSDLPRVDIGERIGIFEYESEPQNDYQAWARKESKKVHNHTTQNHSERVLEKIRAVPSGNGMEKIVGKYGENRVHYCGGYRRALKDKPSYTVYWTRGMTSIHPEQDRFLSPRECARLQSFPDKFIFKGATIENYTQIANAVPPLLANAFGNNVTKSLNTI